ncbi:molybdopterin molybdotransferase MoeA [Vibrio gazogenes]|uniref:Molybdopterin molybdenumtransferase n=1 Tax=Vibrio gazogenes DSM 21264 = NBRC 103151 TaxID=1123492 RepID=A0A1M5C874_VIBGA|nr:molybdopterin molybdotransferase MoeA [Vibrio gazogenes]USP16297.1 molybdopterin molybdotransferase MoeA [Vibrio gazogenes]SHF50949.1 molybdopterin molybdotransferase [Vibrio gazogenes DSM 21264] [Vibrio gazogenes DSM 21264 = NBRC 103151]SJN55365.1 Molybdopterin molybdenumtransferase [Vibrio gazogenes]
MGCCDTQKLLPIEDAIQTMLADVSPIKISQKLSIETALGHVLAEDVRSPIDVPPFDNSAMDGYAVRTQDLTTTDTLPLAGKAFAGQPFSGDWPANTCIRIMTGAPVPQGCDAVIMQEKTESTPEGIRFLTSHVKAQANIRPQGDDLKQNEVVLPAGSRLTVRDLPLLASLGIGQVLVLRKPKVAIFSTGDELKPVGETLNAGQIYDSNRYAIRPMLEKFGCDVLDLGIIPDDQARLTETFQKAQSLADVVITSGGVSVGEADYTRTILESLGKINFWKIAIKPGKPFAFGKLNHSLFCGLPGNPVSAAVTLYVLVQPMLAKLAGHTQWQAPAQMQAVSQVAFKKSPGRTDYQRGVFSVDNGQIVVDNAGNQSSGAFRAMSTANCFIVLEQQRGSVEAGEIVTIEPFNPALY